MRYAITEQWTTRATRDIAIVEAKSAGESLNEGSLELPSWCDGCPIDDDADGGAFIADPDDPDHCVSADPM